MTAAILPQHDASVVPAAPAKRTRTARIPTATLIAHLPALVAEINAASIGKLAATTCPDCGFPRDMHDDGECPGAWLGEVTK